MISYIKRGERMIVILESPDLPDLAAARYRSKRDLRIKKRYYVEMTHPKFSLYLEDLRKAAEAFIGVKGS